LLLVASPQQQAGSGVPTTDPRFYAV
jgi:hypothetical protein